MHTTASHMTEAQHTQNSAEGIERPLEDLGAQMERVAKALEKQSDPKRRFLVGVAFGVGTAIGASVIATAIILALARLLAPIGIDLPSELGQERQVPGVGGEQQASQE